MASFFDSPAAQALLIVGAGYFALQYLKSSGKEAGEAIADTITSIPAEVVSNAYTGGKSFGEQLAQDLGLAPKTMPDTGYQGYDSTGAGYDAKYPNIYKNTAGEFYVKGVGIVTNYADAVAAATGKPAASVAAAPIVGSSNAPVVNQSNIASSKLSPTVNSSGATLLAQVANVVGYTSSNPAVAALQTSSTPKVASTATTSNATASSKIVQVAAGTPINAYGATVAKGASQTIGGITYKGV